MGVRRSRHSGRHRSARVVRRVRRRRGAAAPSGSRARWRSRYRRPTPPRSAGRGHAAGPPPGYGARAHQRRHTRRAGGRDGHYPGGLRQPLLVAGRGAAGGGRGDARLGRRLPPGSALLLRGGRHPVRPAHRVLRPGDLRSYHRGPARAARGAPRRRRPGGEGDRGQPGHARPGGDAPHRRPQGRGRRDRDSCSRLLRRR